MVEKSRPNFIFIMTDQQRADLRKGEGYPLDVMPYLDSLALEGVDFSRAYTPNPICVATRISMLTGRYPSSHRVKCNQCEGDQFYQLDIIDVMNNSGYATALCGKNHSHKKNDDFTFARMTGHTGGDKNRTDISSEEKEFYQYLESLRFVYDPNPTPFSVECQLPYRNVTDAIEFIDKVSEKRPFFLWLSFAEPHNPYQVPEPYYSMFPPESLPKRKAEHHALADKSYKYNLTRSVWEKIGKPDIEAHIARSQSNYLGMLRLIDDQIKRLCDYLKHKEIYDNTHVIFVSDHGDFVGEYGMMRKGPELPEILCRVPYIWRGPGVVAQSERNLSCINHVDFLPTVCDIIKVPLPNGVQGNSLWPILSCGINQSEEKVFKVGYSESGYGGLYWEDNDIGLNIESEGAYRENNNSNVAYDCLNTWTQCGIMRMVRKNEWKLICDMYGRVQLYNLLDDPMETVNLAGINENKEIEADMLKELTTRLLSTQDSLLKSK